MQEPIKNINIDLLVPFENHPFKKRDGIENEELKESIKENGLLEPIIVRSFSAGTYEIISGHRRVEVCRELGIQTVPAIPKVLFPNLQRQKVHRLLNNQSDHLRLFQNIRSKAHEKRLQDKARFFRNFFRNGNIFPLRRIIFLLRNIAGTKRKYKKHRKHCGKYLTGRHFL